MANSDRKIQVAIEGDATGGIKSLSDFSQAAKNTVGEVTSSLGSLGGGINTVIGGFGLLGGLLAGGSMFKGVIDASKNWTGEVVRLSKAMGMSTEQASVYNVALRTNGIDVDVAIGATAKLTRTLATNEQVFKTHNIAVRDASGHLLPMPQVITNVYEALSKLESGTSRNTAAQEFMGRSFLQLSSLAKINQAAMVDAARSAQELGLMVGGDAADAMRKYNIEMNKMALSGTAFKINVANAVKPAFLEISKLCNDFLKDAAVKDTIAFMANPFDFARNQASYFTQHSSRYPMVRQAMPQRPSKGGGEEYDPAKAKADALAAAQAEADALAAAQATDALFKSYLSTREGLNKQLVGMNPNFSELQRKLLDVDGTVAKLTRDMPQYSSTWQDFGVKMKGNITITENLRKETAAYKEEAKETEEVLKGMGSLAVLGSGLNATLGQPKNKTQSQFSLDGSRGAKKNYGADLLGGQSADISPGMTQQEVEEKKKIESEFEAWKGQIEGDSSAKQLLLIQKQEDAWIKSYALLGGSTEAYEKRKTEIQRLSAAERIKITEDEETKKLGITISAANSAYSLTDSMQKLVGSKNKEAFKAFQALKAGETVVSTASAAMKAYEDGAKVSPYLGALYAAAAVAAGMVQLDNIWSASPSGGSSSGISGGSGGGTSFSDPSSSQFVTQPQGGQNRQEGAIVVNITGNVIGEQSWVENNLIPSINDAAGRGTTINIPK